MDGQPHEITRTQRDEVAAVDAQRMPDELSDDQLEEVWGGLNPQPIPPGRQ